MNRARTQKTIALPVLGCAAAVLPAGAAAKWSRDWKIYVITHAHADVGYTDLIPGSGAHLAPGQACTRTSSRRMPAPEELVHSTFYARGRASL